MWWAYDDVHSLRALFPLVYTPTRSAVGFGLERSPGQRRISSRSDAGFTPRSRGTAPVRSRRTCWVPRLHPRIGIPRLLDGARRVIGEGGLATWGWRGSRRR